jgi:hypothetical protein
MGKMRRSMPSAYINDSRPQPDWLPTWTYVKFSSEMLVTKAKWHHKPEDHNQHFIAYASAIQTEALKTPTA